MPVEVVTDRHALINRLHDLYLNFLVKLYCFSDELFIWISHASNLLEKQTYLCLLYVVIRNVVQQKLSCFASCLWRPAGWHSYFFLKLLNRNNVSGIAIKHKVFNYSLYPSSTHGNMKNSKCCCCLSNCFYVYMKNKLLLQIAISMRASRKKNNMLL